MSTYKINKVEQVLLRLHEDAKNDYKRIGKGMIRSIFRPLEPSDFQNVYLPISKKQGDFLQQLVVNNDCKNVIEFGTSFGISTIYLADAVRETGGKVITTELIESKAQRAIQNITNAGLSDFVDVRVGDAMKTLEKLDEPIDFLFLDGWKDLYLPLFKMLEPRFHKKTLIYADNMDMAGTRFYGNYVLRQNQKYTSQMVERGKAMITAFAA